MTTLKDRCRTFLVQALAASKYPTFIDIVDDLEAFVIAENGRAAAGGDFDDVAPLCLYFGTKEDRDNFIAVVAEAKPNMTCRRLP